MKQFFTILKFELDNYFKSKSYVISTILIAVLAAGIMFVPRVKDAITGDKKDSTVQDSAYIWGLRSGWNIGYRCRWFSMVFCG